MLVERIWAANPLRNYHYLIGCAETGEALVIDPLNAGACLQRAKQRGWTITQIVNTHEHNDHTDGNAEVVRATGAKVLAHAGAAKRIGGVDRGLVAGDVIRVGRSVELESLDTPGHTMTHVCLLAHGSEAALFSGDTLFNAGVGNCRNGGDPELLYSTCHTLLQRLPASTKVYPGHDYLMNNLRFTQHVEPTNPTVGAWLERYKTTAAEEMPVVTLQDELRINSFFRLAEPGLREGLRQRVAELGTQVGEREVFLRLRELRNSW